MFQYYGHFHRFSVPWLNQNIEGMKVGSYVGMACQKKPGRKLNKRFKQLTSQLIHEEFHYVDFVRNRSGALSMINGAVKRGTNGKVPQILKPDAIKPGTDLVIVSAFAFKV